MAMETALEEIHNNEPSPHTVPPLPKKNIYIHILGSTPKSTV